jgi:hypothetical protein
VPDRDRGSSNEEALDLTLFARVLFLVGAFFANFLVKAFFFTLLEGFVFFFRVAFLRVVVFGLADFLLGFLLVAIRAV